MKKPLGKPRGFLFANPAQFSNFLFG
jgi:hypothetical protein